MLAFCSKFRIRFKEGILFQDENMAEINLQIKKFLIKKQPVFSKLTDEEVKVLATLFTTQHFNAGDTIVVEGDFVDSVYLIVNGTADVKQVIQKDGGYQVRTISTLGPEESIGLNERGFYSLTGMRTATVVANNKMTLLRLSVTEFHGFALSYSHVNKVMRENAEKLLNVKL